MITSVSATCSSYPDAAAAIDAGWDAVPGADTIYRSARWLRSLDANPVGHARQYWLARRGDRPVGAACTLTSQDGAHPAGDARSVVIDDLADETAALGPGDASSEELAAYRASIDALDRSLPAAPCWRVISLPYAWQPGVWGADRAAVHALVAAALPRDGPSAVTAVPDDAVELASCLVDQGFRRVAQRPTTELVLTDTPDWATYRGRFSRRRRQALTRERRALPEDARVQVVPLPRLGARSLTCVARLLAAHDTEKGRPVTTEAMTHTLTDLAAVFDDRVEAVLCRRGDEIGGAVIILHDGPDHLAVKMFGADADLLPRTTFPYFNLCFYETIEYAALRGVQAIDYGPSAYEAKLRRGCRIAPLSVWVHPGDEPTTDAMAAHLSRVDVLRRRAVTAAYGADSQTP